MIVERIENYFRSQAKVWPVRSNRASELGHPCLRYLVFLRTRWQDRALPSPRLLAIFREGQIHEDAVLRLLQESGFTIVEQQRPFFWEEYQITGKIDAKLGLDERLAEELNQAYGVSLNGHRPLVPLEIKSCSSMVFKTIEDYQGLKSSKYLWIRKYPAQMVLYLLMDNKEIGLMLFKDKQTGAIKEVWIPLDWDLGEELLKKAEAVNRHVAEGTIPSAEWDEDYCPECPFLHICSVEARRTAMDFSEDSELAEKIRRWWELKPLKAEYDRLDEEIKKAVKGKEKMVVGGFLVTGRWEERKPYTVKGYRYWKKKIVPLSEAQNL